MKFRLVINDIRFIKSGFDVAKKIWPKPLQQHMLSRRAGLVRLYLSKNVFEKGKARGNTTQMGGIAANTVFARMGDTRGTESGRPHRLCRVKRDVICNVARGFLRDVKCELLTILPASPFLSTPYPLFVPFRIVCSHPARPVPF